MRESVGREVLVLVLILVVGAIAGCGDGGGSSGNTCGNHVVESREQCDDGNTIDGDGCSSRCAREGAVERDLSEGLVTFRYFLRPGLGFCAQAGGVYRVEIAQGGDGNLTVTGSVLEAGDRAGPSCVPEVTTGACLVERDVTQRTLSETETNRVFAAFESVRIETEPEPGCGSEDPCLVDRFIWINDLGQGEVATDVVSDPCGPKLAESDERAIKELVASLVL